MLRRTVGACLVVLHLEREVAAQPHEAHGDHGGEGSECDRPQQPHALVDGLELMEREVKVRR